MFSRPDFSKIFTFPHVEDEVFQILSNLSNNDCAILICQKLEEIEYIQMMNEYRNLYSQIFRLKGKILNEFSLISHTKIELEQFLSKVQEDKDYIKKLRVLETRFLFLENQIKELKK